ncbi:hypothetical protein ACWGQ5_54660 [Streptomyces sp. NPDC055722]
MRSELTNEIEGGLHVDAYQRVEHVLVAVAAFNPTERRKGKTIIRVRP